ncbi:hypothetical protein [Gordonia soli]|uniref:Uncharacterized protein n=1 Tax=Gordonia soli NBRC 108243 TaxID=1223545 RepID=M0QPL4_9ACTN|nr:hypothetical protein [Gordonia soli]GAC70513.1 hypothetical protein GS4_35_00890 [Gordonia soli NBRC 108243]
MNLADQIEAVSRRATDTIVAASTEFSTTQNRLAAEFAEHRRAGAGAEVDHREALERAADLADTATPRILLPADTAEASPHRRNPDA